MHPPPNPILASKQPRSLEVGNTRFNFVHTALTFLIHSEGLIRGYILFVFPAKLFIHEIPDFLSLGDDAAIQAPPTVFGLTVHLGAMYKCHPNSSKATRATFAQPIAADFHGQFRLPPEAAKFLCTKTVNAKGKEHVRKTGRAAEVVWMNGSYEVGRYIFDVLQPRKQRKYSKKMVQQFTLWMECLKANKSVLVDVTRAGFASAQHAKMEAILARTPRPLNSVGIIDNAMDMLSKVLFTAEKLYSANEMFFRIEELEYQNQISTFASDTTYENRYMIAAASASNISTASLLVLVPRLAQLCSSDSRFCQSVSEAVADRFERSLIQAFPTLGSFLTTQVKAVLAIYDEPMFRFLFGIAIAGALVIALNIHQYWQHFPQLKQPKAATPMLVHLLLPCPSVQSAIGFFFTRKNISTWPVYEAASS